jgi:hypothetical protein
MSDLPAAIAHDYNLTFLEHFIPQGQERKSTGSPTFAR